MKYDLIIFDLDGTILDTLNDLADACNAALAAHGFPPRTLEEVRLFIGSGISNLIQRALPEEAVEAMHAEVLRSFKKIYFSNLNVKTVPYPGVPDMLKKLKSSGMHIAVNSNKIDPAVQELCRAHFADFVELAVGEREGTPKKPSPIGVQQIMDAFSCPAGRTLYVGDSNVDIATAQNAGIDCAWVSWGFRHREELGYLAIPHAFDTIDSLTEFILQ